MKNLRLHILFLLLLGVGCHSGTPVFSDEGENDISSEPVSSPSVNLSASDFFIGALIDDSTADLNFWRAAERRVSARYIYINGGFTNGWRTWSGVDGGRAIHFIHNSFDMGMTPFFVFYQIPGGGSGGFDTLFRMQRADYVRSYFKDLQFFLDIVRLEGAGKEVGIILEPDALGYLMQSDPRRPASEMFAAVSGAYTSGVLGDGDPLFPDTMQGFVEAVNHTVRKYAPNASFGWQVNLWASPGIGYRIPNTGLMHITDGMGLVAGREAIRYEAMQIARYYAQAGILSANAKWVFIDKYGLDGAGAFCADPERNPKECRWFWNSDHWNNYVVFVEALHAELQKPVILWQIPMGHINRSQERVEPLGNVSRSFEDSAGTFILGDTFEANNPERLAYFGDVDDFKTTRNGSLITVRSHMEELAVAGAAGVLFGPGVGEATDFDSDGGWWVGKVGAYLK